MRNLVVLFALVGTANAQERRTVTLYDVQRAATPPAIDGRLDEPCWQNRPVITDLVLRDAPTRVRARVQTRTILLYDDQALYIGIVLAEPFPRTLRASYRQYDGQLWWDDSVELYIETGCTHRMYFKLMSNPLGTRADWRGILTPEGFKMLDWGTGAAWTVAAHVGADFWSLEFRIPWADLEVQPPRPGDIWSFEVVRFRYAHDPDAKGEPDHEYSSWNVGASYSAPARFGNIVFGGSTDAFERMLAEKLAPVFGPAIRLYGRQGELSYTQYPALLKARAAEATTALAAAAKRLDVVKPQLEPKAAEEIQKRYDELRGRLAALSAAEPSPASAEDVAKLTGQIDGLDWTLKYHELNAKLGSSR